MSVIQTNDGILSFAMPAHFPAEYDVCSSLLYGLQIAVLLNETVMCVVCMYLHMQCD